MRCILVDDNKMARMALGQLISQLSDLELLAQCETAIEAYNWLEKESADLVFLDIEMPGLSGLELARQLKGRNTYIIFTTGKKDYALEAFGLNVADYLLKPIALNRLLEAVSKVKELMNKVKTEVKIESDLFFVKDKGALKQLKMDEILYIEAMGDYVKVQIKDRYYMIHNTLKVVEQKLNPDAFLRIHRSFIIALNKIDKIEDGVVTIQQTGIPVADAYRSVLNQRIKLL